MRTLGCGKEDKMASHRRRVSSIGFCALLLLLTALLVRNSWAQEGPTIKILDVPKEGLTFDYQELQEMKGFQIVVYGENITTTIIVTGTIVDRSPCNSGHAQEICASEMFTSPVTTTMKPGLPVTLTFSMD